MKFSDQIKDLIINLKSTIIIDDFSNLNLSQIDEGILLVYASWSGQARMNFSATLNFLNEIGYNKKALIVDTDCFSADQYISTFGKVLNGAGEIFIIKNGVISESYFGYTCY